MEGRESAAADRDARGRRDRERTEPETGKAAVPRWRAVLKENLEIAVLVATGLVAMITVVGTVVGSARWLKADLEADIAQVKHDLEADIAQLRHDLEADIAQLRHDLEAKIGGVAGDMEWRIDTTSGGLQHQIVGLREQMNSMQQQINALQEQVAQIALRLPARDPDGSSGPAGAPDFIGSASGAPE